MSKVLKRKSAIVLLISIIFLALIISIYILITRNANNSENTTIIATKTISNENQTTKYIEYKIKIKNYNLRTIEKKITFETKEKAQIEYDRYQIINENEGKGINAQVDGKKVIITMTEEQFKEDIEYKEDTNTSMMSQTGEQREILNQDGLIELLKIQGYEVK